MRWCCVRQHGEEKDFHDKSEGRNKTLVGVKIYVLYHYKLIRKSCFLNNHWKVPEE
jgi:hypothetical protein